MIWIWTFSTTVVIIRACACLGLFVATLTNTVHLIYIYGCGCGYICIYRVYIYIYIYRTIKICPHNFCFLFIDIYWVGKQDGNLPPSGVNAVFVDKNMIARARYNDHVIGGRTHRVDKKFVSSLDGVPIRNIYSYEVRVRAMLNLDLLIGTWHILIYVIMWYHPRHIQNIKWFSFYFSKLNHQYARIVPLCCSMCLFVFIINF